MADFSGARLSDADFTGACLIRASFRDAQAASSKFGRAPGPPARDDLGGDASSADFTNCTLTAALFYSANLTDAKLDHIDAERVSFDASTLDRASLRGAELRNGRFKGTTPTQADFSEADLRGAEGLVFDDNPIRGATLDHRSLDPWSKLLEAYTGAKLTVHLALFVLFLGSLAGKAAFAIMFAVRDAATAAIADPAAALAFHSVPLISILSGWYAEDAIGRGFIVLLIAYNLARVVMTLRISRLRDLAESNARTPPWWVVKAAPEDRLWAQLGNAVGSYAPLVKIHAIVTLIGYLALATGIVTYARFALLQVVVPVTAP